LQGARRHEFGPEIRGGLPLTPHRHLLLLNDLWTTEGWGPRKMMDGDLRRALLRTRPVVMANGGETRGLLIPDGPGRLTVSSSDLV